MSDDIESLIGVDVVLDTAGPMIYLGRLASIRPEGFWLKDADVHNGNEGHAPCEQYVIEASRDGIRINRQRVFVFRHTVTSLSALEDVGIE